MGKYTDPDWENSALVTIDAQNDFTLPGAPSAAGSVDLLPTLRSLVAAFRDAGRPIFHVVRLSGYTDLMAPTSTRAAGRPSRAA